MSGDPKEARQVVSRGISAWERDDFEGALETFLEVLEAFPEFADVQNKAGLCLAMLGRTEEALDRFEQAVETNPGYAEAHLNLGIVLNDLGRHDEAHEAFRTAGDLDAQDSPIFPSEVGNRIAVTHAQLGDLYLVANHPEKAAEHYHAALDIRPRFMDIRSKYAETLIDLDRLDEARAELETILEARPGFVGARVKLGVVLHRQGLDDEAAAEWTRCLEDDAHDMRARAYLVSIGIEPHTDRDEG
jgi:tetratricopeptide (TPR) repeat protein